MSADPSVESLAAIADRSVRRLELSPLGPEAPPVEFWEEVQRVLVSGGAAVVGTHGMGRRAIGKMVAQASQYLDLGPVHGDTLQCVRRGPKDMAEHFGHIAPHYWGELPEHVQARFLERKVGLIRRYVPSGPDIVGLDVGCGVGRHAAEVARRVGGRVIGLDPARAALEESRSARHDARVDEVAGDSTRLPLRAGRLDYAYSINVLHHLKRGEQERALREVARALRPGGVLIVHEMNTRNPFFRWYLRRVFPRVRPIDRGDEEFIHPDRWPLVAELDVVAIEYATFLPDFLPAWATRMLGPLERGLEAGPARGHAVHYAAVLRRPGGDDLAPIRDRPG